jgi:molybdopterin molybdotransferase
MSDPCHDPSQKLISADECIEYLLQKALPVTDVETVPVRDALGRVLAADQVSQVTVPPSDNSAMDGYAVRVEDLTGEDTRLPVSQRVPAGQVAAPLIPGTAARIFTGAPLPQGADAVVMQELCEQLGDEVIIKAKPQPGQSIRRAGEDLRAGDVVLRLGQRLRPQDLGLAASVGLATIPVFRRLRVAVFSTGDELVEPGKPLGEGQIYNSNRYTLTGLLQGLGCEIVDLGQVADTLEATREALQQAADKADVIVTSGGVSVGEEDYIKIALQELGELHMWRVAMKPGKPVAYGEINDAPLIGLPGNPVSVFVTFCLFARPYLLRCMGANKVRPQPITVSAAFEWSRAGPRREFVRAQLETTKDGNVSAILYPHQGSGILTSTVWATGLVVINEHTTVKSGDPVSFISFDQLLG